MVSIQLFNIGGFCMFNTQIEKLVSLTLFQQVSKLFEFFTDMSKFFLIYIVDRENANGVPEQSYARLCC